MEIIVDKAKNRVIECQFQSLKMVVFENKSRNCQMLKF